MSWPRSVRARLALWYALALLAVVSIYAVAVVLQVRDDLYETLDGQLAGDYELAVQWLQQARDARAAAVPESPQLGVFGSIRSRTCATLGAVSHARSPRQRASRPSR